jgi:alpha-beta hydrolase superfamily lysophospholipase
MAEDKEEDSSSFLDDPLVLLHMFYPRKSDVLEVISGGEVISFEVDEGVNIDCVVFLAEKQAPNVLFFHGNGEIAYDYEDIGPLYASRGINFLVADYRGYGSSGGCPKYSSMLKDAEITMHNFRAYLESRDFSGGLFVMGRSLGSAPALELASIYPHLITGLIIESGFAHTYNLLLTLGVDPNLLNPEKEILVSNLEKMKKVSSPALIIHGEKDEIIPVTDGIDLYSAALAEDKELLLIPEAGHNTLFCYGLEAYLEAVRSFVIRLNPNRSPSHT